MIMIYSHGVFFVTWQHFDLLWSYYFLFEKKKNSKIFHVRQQIFGVANISYQTVIRLQDFVLPKNVIFVTLWLFFCSITTFWCKKKKQNRDSRIIIIIIGATVLLALFLHITSTVAFFIWLEHYKQICISCSGAVCLFLQYNVYNSDFILKFPKSSVP